MGCGTNTVMQQSSPPPQVLNDYQNLINQGQQVSSLPLSQYQGPVIAGFNPTQQSAFGEINQAQGSQLPYLNAAQSYVAAGAQPVMGQVQGFNALGEYQNPYTQQVTQGTENLFNQQNAQQFNQANAAAASEGAFGGDRQAVLEAQMAQQQQLAEAPTLANIQSQGFTGAEQQLNAQQQLQLQGASASSWLAQNAANTEAGLGAQAQNSLLSGASAQMQAGGLEQQLQQEQLAYPQSLFQQQQAFPYAQTNYLAGITEGAGAGMGGSGSTTYPGPLASTQIAGLGMAGLGTYGMGSQLGWWGGNTAAGAAAGAAAATSAAAAAGAMAGSAGAGDAAASMAAFAQRGGRIAGFPSIERDAGGFVSVDATGAGMPGSRSRSPGVALGEGIKAGPAQQETQSKRQRPNSPRVDSSGNTMRLVYPDGRIFDTGLGTGLAEGGAETARGSAAE